MKLYDSLSRDLKSQKKEREELQRLAMEILRDMK